MEERPSSPESARDPEGCAPSDESCPPEPSTSGLRNDARPVQVEGLSVFDEPDGCVVHQPTRNRVHFLNHTAAFVFELCTGRHTIGEIEGILAGFFDMTEPPEEAAAKALRQLIAEGLVRIP